MLRKKEKKTIASMIALLIGWPVGLDQFVEGNNEKGLAIIVGWILTLVMLFLGVRNLGRYDNEVGIGILVMFATASIVGGVLATVKLVKLLRAFVEADD